MRSQHDRRVIRSAVLRFPLINVDDKKTALQFVRWGLLLLCILPAYQVVTIATAVFLPVVFFSQQQSTAWLGVAIVGRQPTAI